MLTPTVLQLRCPACGGSLEGTPQAILFWCRDCGAVQEVADGRFMPRTMRTARPEARHPGRLVHLPLWAFRVQTHWTRPEAAGPAPMGWRAPAWAYVTAFALSNGFYFGDPGVIFTQKRTVFVEGEPAPLLGGTRGLEEAKRFVEPHILSLADRRADVTGVEVGCAIDEAVVWAVPFYDDGLTLVDGILGLKLPGAALDEIGALRAWWEKKR